MCFIFIWEQTATCATYSINWLVFITETKIVYCAVWTGPLNKVVINLLKPTYCTWCTNSLTCNNCTLCPHCIYVFCIYLRTNSDLCHLQHKLIGFYNRYGKCLLCGANWVFKGLNRFDLSVTWGSHGGDHVDCSLLAEILYSPEANCTSRTLIRFRFQ